MRAAFIVTAGLAAATSEPKQCDVLVLGAGLAGTSAAWRIVGERPNAESTPTPKVCVLEANDQVGGRTRDYDIPGCRGPQRVEMGAQWIAQQDVDSDVWDLALNVLNLGIYNGWPWALYGFPYGPALIDPEVKARLDKIPSVSPPFDDAAAFFGPNVSPEDPQAGACKDRVAEVYRSVVMASPWLTPNASTIDAMTPLEWLDSQGCNITKADVVAQGLNQVDMDDPKTPLPPAFYVSLTSAGSSGQEIFWQSSALWWLHNIKSNHGPVSMAVDLQRYRIVGGPQQMSVRLAEKLRAAGASVELNSPVHKVRYSHSGVEFTTKDGRVYQGRYAVLTGTPVALSTHLTWEPALSAGVDTMLKQSAIGNYNKHYAFFNEGPVWKGNKSMWAAISKVQVPWPMVYEPNATSGQAMTQGSAFFPSAPIDNSPPSVDTQDEGCPAGAGALFSFGWPKNSTNGTHRAEGWRELLRSVPGLPEPSTVYGKAWAEEPYVMGAYGAWWRPGVISAAGPEWSAVPGGRVFFAGSEWAEEGAGYMNGAIHNGRKHGDIILKKLQKEAAGLTAMVAMV